MFIPPQKHFGHLRQSKYTPSLIGPSDYFKQLTSNTCKNVCCDKFNMLTESLHCWVLHNKLPIATECMFTFTRQAPLVHKRSVFVLSVAFLKAQPNSWSDIPGLISHFMPVFTLQLTIVHLWFVPHAKQIWYFQISVSTKKSWMGCHFSQSPSELEEYKVQNLITSMQLAF